jgi:hypothetical protein
MPASQVCAQNALALAADLLTLLQHFRHASSLCLVRDRAVDDVKENPTTCVDAGDLRRDRPLSDSYRAAAFAMAAFPYGALRDYILSV